MTRDEAARLFLGVPFRHQGRNPEIGIDCIGLIVNWGKVLGLPFVDFDFTDYGREPLFGLLETHLDIALGGRLPTELMQPGDVAAMDFKGQIRHVGIIAQGPGYLTLIHTNGALKRVTEARVDAKWQKRIKGIYRP